MSYEITVLYPKSKEKPPRVLAAQSEITPGKIDLKSLETDLASLIKTLENLPETKYGVDEVKVVVGIAEDSEGKIHIGFLASLLSLFKGEITSEIGEKINQNQLFEITIRKK